MEALRFEFEAEGHVYIITLLHNMGEKWSIFLKYVMEEGILTTIGSLPKFEINEGSLVIRIGMS